MAVAETNQRSHRSAADGQGRPGEMPGVIAEEYKADVEQVIRRLNTMRSTELCSYLQYKQHAYMVVSMVGPSVREEFIEHANEELRHADMLAERIQQLG